MKAAFIGGGSLRLLPIFRGIFHKTPEVFQNGEIRLIDLKRERAEAVARMTAACPEYQNVKCKITVTSDLDEALDGVDVLYLTMAAVREPSQTQSFILGKEYDYIASDQLSIMGAFLSLRLGGFILSLARKLEKSSPDALMLIFPNPVAVYSCMVNRFTKIRALGICGGFSNHRYDLSRLCFGRNGYDPEWNVVAAGVNHLSFILRGEYKGEDLYGSLLPRTLTDSWKMMDFSPAGSGNELLEIAIRSLYRMYRKYGTMIFSTEYDGMAHIVPESTEAEVVRRQIADICRNFDPEKIRRESLAEIEKRFADFIRLSAAPAQVDWNQKNNAGLPTGRNITDISIPILKALAGFEKMRIVASRPNYGVIAGLPENAACEYTMDICKDAITPVENQYIPSPFRGLIASLSEFQTLNAEALAEHDPKLFAAALDAYPCNRFTKKRKEFFRKMFDIHTDIDPVWRQSLDQLM